MSELDELIGEDDEAETTPETETVEETTAEAASEPEAPKPEPAVAEPEHVPVAALLDERRKRQQAEEELAALRKPAEERPDPLDDPEGAIAYVESSVDRKLKTAIIDMSRDLMMSQFDDYETREARFAEMAKADPTLAQRMVASPNPARFAYETARKAEEWEAMQDVDSYKAKIRAEIEAEYAAKNGTKPTASRERLPPSLSKAASSGGDATPTNETLEDILGR